MSVAMLEGRKILITGPAGQIAFPMARELARRNEVWGIARFGDPKSRQEVEDAGIRTRVVDLGRPDFSELPRDFTHLLHLAASIGSAADPERRRAITGACRVSWREGIRRVLEELYPDQVPSGRSR